MARLVFDFLGFMWMLIIFGIVQILFCIFGIFGGIQKRSVCILLFLMWNICSFGCNIFVICVYEKAGILSVDLPILDFGVSNRGSWWHSQKIACISNNVTLDPVRSQTDPENCHMETIIAALQLIISFINIMAAILCLVSIKRNKYLNESWSRSRRISSVQSTLDRSDVIMNGQTVVYSVDAISPSSDSLTNQMEPRTQSDFSQSVSPCTRTEEAVSPPPPLRFADTPVQNSQLIERYENSLSISETSEFPRGSRQRRNSFEAAVTRTTQSFGAPQVPEFSIGPELFI